MSEIATIKGGGALQQHVPPEERGYRIAALEAAEKHAKNRGDLLALREACERRLKENLDTWRDYTEAFPHGRNQHGVESTLSVDSTSRTQWLKAIGKSDQTVRRWAGLEEPGEMEKLRDRIVEATAKRLDLEEAANFSSESNEWYTPPQYIEAVRELYGGSIDLDPATCPFANETVRAAQIFTIDDDAFSHEWHGNAFLNPPYGKDGQDSLAGKFCRYAIAQYEAGNLDACVILVNSVHSQRWQAPLYDHPVCFVDHRIAFVNSDGIENKNPTFQNIFVYIGAHENAFCEAFSKFGYVMVRV